MEVIENATHLKARLLESAEDASRPGWLRCEIEVRETAPVQDLPRLVHAVVGERLSVLVSPADRLLLGELKTGEAIGMQVRLRAPGTYTVVPGSLAVE